MKTLKTSIYDNLEFVFTTSTYSTTGNTYVGIHCKENDRIEPYCNLTVNLDMQLGKGLAFIDVNNADKRLLLFLEEQGFISPTGVTKPSGFAIPSIGSTSIKSENTNFKENTVMVNKQYVYLITLDWATEDDKGFEFDICSTPKKAFEIFRKRIKAEQNPNKSWVGEEVFAEDGSVKESYILDTFVDCTFSESSRRCVSDDDTGRFSDIYLRRVLLQ